MTETNKKVLRVTISSYFGFPVLKKEYFLLKGKSPYVKVFTRCG